MEIDLERVQKDSDCTIGKLYVNGTFECYTVEDVVRPHGVKVYGKTAIPKGRYRVVITYSNRFKVLMPLLVNVPQFEGIRIHPGNTAEDTEGCILPGKDRRPKGVGRSRLAYNALYSKIDRELKAGKDVWITITEDPGNDER
jgi:hypothetical protein